MEWGRCVAALSVRSFNMDRKLAQPGLAMAVALALIVIGLQMFLAMPLALADVVIERALHQEPLRLAQHPLIVALVNLLAFGGAIGFGLFLNRLPFTRAFPLQRPGFLETSGIFVVVLGSGIVLSEADNVTRALLPPPDWLMDVFAELFYEEERLFARVFLLVIVAPVTEELLFRGLVLRGLLNRFRPATAVVLTAGLFAAIHLNPWQLISAFCLGVAFGWFYLRTGSIALCILAHAFANGLVVLCSLLPVEVPGLIGTPGDDRMEFQPMWLNLAGVVLLGAGLWVFQRATAPRPQPEAPPVIPGAPAH